MKTENDRVTFEVDFKELVTNRRAQRIKKAVLSDMRKRFSYVALILAVLCAIGPTISICASATPTDDVLKETDPSAALSKQQGSDILTLQTFQTSPFVTPGGGTSQDGYIEHRQTFEELARDLSINANYELFSVAAQAVLDKSGLCSGTSAGSGSGIEAQLKGCANDLPEEFATFSTMIRSYIEWQTSELHTISGYYQNKITSPVLKDRIEGRLVQECLRQQLATKDTAAAMDVCRKTANWPVTKTFYATCFNNSSSATADNSKFDYKTYVKTCVLSNVVKASLGATLFYDMIPNFTISVDTVGVTFRSTPFTQTPASIYHLIYEQTYAQLTSPWFQQFATQGCIPSVFAPTDFAAKVIAKDKSVANYYSICLPQKLIESINGLPKIDQEFFNSVLAKRLSMIQVIELLNGSTMIAEETHRNLMAADREIGNLVESYPRYMSSVEKMYKEQIDLVHGKKLDDILEKVETLVGKYSAEAASSDKGQTDTIDELVRMKNHRSNGE